MISARFYSIRGTNVALSTFIIFFIIFQILFAFASGGVAPRIMYACTVSTGFLNFLQNYALSYQVKYSQIHSTEEFIPEVNSKLEKLLTLSLIGEASVGLSTEHWDESGRVLRIQKPGSFDGSYGTVRFAIDSGKIDGSAYALSPTVFILAQKVHDMQTNKQQLEKLEKKRNVI